MVEIKEKGNLIREIEYILFWQEEDKMIKVRKNGTWESTINGDWENNCVFIHPVYEFEEARQEVLSKKINTFLLELEGSDENEDQR